MTRDGRQRPNFFIAGVPKAGTTSLYHYLNQHPQIYMSRIKEPAFFGAADLLAGPHRDHLLRWLESHRTALRTFLDGPQMPGAQYVVLEWEEYLRLFRDVRDQIAVGEASVDYFWQPSAAAAIRARLPDARIIIVLRDPTQMLVTRYLLNLWRDPHSTFRDWFLANRASTDGSWPPLGPGRYGTHLQRFVDVFPRHQLRIYLFQDYQADPRAVLRDIFAFLGVDSNHPVDLSERRNETVVPRFPLLHNLRRRLLGGAPVPGWLPDRARRLLRRVYQRPRASVALDPADRRLVVDYYRNDILRAADLIGRDLSVWLQ